jgi:hypothetical protein
MLFNAARVSSVAVPAIPPEIPETKTSPAAFVARANGRFSSGFGGRMYSISVIIPSSNTSFNTGLVRSNDDDIADGRIPGSIPELRVARSVIEGSVTTNPHARIVDIVEVVETIEM